MQQDNNLKHISKSTAEWHRKKEIKALQSPALNLTDMLRWDLNRVVHKLQ